MTLELPHDDLYDKPLNCPVCLFKSTTKKIKSSKVKSKKINNDFYTEYYSDNPNYYSIFICPNCGYAAFENDFPSVTDGERERIKENITRLWKKRSYASKREPTVAIETYKLALLCYWTRGSQNMVFAKIALRISWIYRDLNDQENIRKYEEVALDYFEKAYANDIADSDEMEIQLMFMSAELNRKLGRLDKSIQCFSSLLRDERVKKMRIIEVNARYLWNLASEEYREINNQ